MLVQGNSRPTPPTERVAAGDRKLVALDPPRSQAAADRRLEPAAAARLLAHGLPGRASAVPPTRGAGTCAARESLAPARAPRAATAAAAGWLDYAFDLGPRCAAIVLDTVRRDRRLARAVHPAQLRWLRGELARAGARWVVVFSHTPLDRRRRRGGAARPPRPRPARRRGGRRQHAPQLDRAAPTRPAATG